MVIISYKGIAQDWSCAVEDKKFFYINGTGYLRMMMYDSVQTNGNNVHYYPYKTIRATPCFNIYDIETVDSNGASWWGKELIATDTGYTFLYNHINDTIVIKNNAALNDSWILYTTDSLDFVYQATVTQIDTMTILGNVDSVKIITISVFDKMNNPVADSTNGTEIILSKEHGLVQTLDWYMFPYRDNNGYYPIDIECFYSILNEDNKARLTLQVFLFKISEFKPILNYDIHNYEIGEEFLESGYSDGVSGGMETFTHYSKILDKKASDSNIIYTIQYDRAYTSRGVTKYYYDTTTTKVNNTIIADSSLQLEKIDINNLAYYYFPEDSSYCHKSTLFSTLNTDAYFTSPYSMKGKTFTKLGMGIVYSYGGYHQQGYSSSGLKLAKKASYDSVCNALNQATFIKELQHNKYKSSQFTLYPNPAHTFINIDFNGIDNNNTSLIMYNITGKEVLRQSNIQQHTPIDIRNIPTGLYFIKLQSGEYFGTKKLVIER